MAWRGLLPWLAGCGLHWSHDRDHAPDAPPPPLDSSGVTNQLHDAREQHTAARLADGRVLVTGGEDLAGVLATSELYDGAWSTAEAMHQPRVDHALVVLNDGTLLVAGGYKQLDGIRCSSRAPTSAWCDSRRAACSRPAAGPSVAG